MGKQDGIAEEDLSMLERNKRNEVRRLQKSLKSVTAKGRQCEKFHSSIFAFRHFLIHCKLLGLQLIPVKLNSCTG
jgi:hypothetical protein